MDTQHIPKHGDRDSVPGDCGQGHGDIQNVWHDSAGRERHRDGAKCVLHRPERHHPRQTDIPADQRTQHRRNAALTGRASDDRPR